MNNGGAEKISNAAQGAQVTLNHVVTQGSSDALKNMLLKKKAEN